MPVQAEVRVSDAWVRAVPPVSSGTAGYFVLENGTAEPLVLQGASADFARHIMLHSMAPDDEGLRRMTHEDEILVAPGESVRFAPGDLHLMIMGLQPVPQAGEVVTICLQFQALAQQCVPFDVRRPY